ncbi:hypothetical protein AAG570_008999 [Ranatra chinensis]|uniref:PAS domain-containing protein n=1 Tax=Ranatra chinensis TaxID=642074 RepID=A0ABD0Z5D2_9HEMI
MVSLAIALPPPSVHEIRLESDMFVTRLTLDFRIAHCEPRVADLLDYTADELTGMNMYTLCHGEDANMLRKSHVDLINKGQVLTHYYRLMNKNGGYTWVQTCGTVVCSSKNADEQNIICVNYVVSGREYGNLIMDCCQLEDHVASRSVKREETGGNDPENGSPDSEGPEGRSGGSGLQQSQQQQVHQDQQQQQQQQRGGGTAGGATNHQPPDMEDRSPAEPQDHRTLMNNVLGRSMKKDRKGHKRKIGEEESSCCSSEDEERSVSVRKRYPVLSPASSSCHSSALASSPKQPHQEDSDGGGGGGGTSVKDLEQAMTKHLPSADKGTPPGAPVLHRPTDFSADTLLKAQQQRSTIQWIGAHHAHHAVGAAGAPLPATTLLRQLYANRESVIRANVRPTGAGGPGMSHTGPLPTPPGSEASYGDQFALQSQKANDFGSLVSAYSGGGYTVDYHSAMTPPSSVSPRDKHQQQAAAGPGGGFDSPPVYTADVLRHQYLGGGGGAESPAQPLPLKPQPYPVHAGALDAYATAGTLDQSQFYHHHHHGAAPTPGFHLYHPAPGKAAATSAPPPVYPDPLKTATPNWYSTPS